MSCSSWTAPTGDEWAERITLDLQYADQQSVLRYVWILRVEHGGDQPVGPPAAEPLPAAPDGFQTLEAVIGRCCLDAHVADVGAIAWRSERGDVRRVRRRRPLSRARVDPPPGSDLSALAVSATYIISAEHKDYLTEAGPGALRSDASACPREVTRDQAESWLRQALAAGHVGAPWDVQPYPQYAWFRHEGEVYEARLSNPEQGAYKGYPLDTSEWPAWLP